MQKKIKTDYDVTKNMLKTIRTLTESVINKKSLNENEEPQQNVDFDSPDVDTSNQNVQNNITVINDVDVKMLSTDKRDMELKPEQEEVISKLIDSFRQQVSQIVDFKPGITINQKQIRLDGTLTDEDINFVFIAGEESGVYINADMLKLEQNIANTLTKLAKYEETFTTELAPIITQRDNN
jgi:hypothetical protein